MLKAADVLLEVLDARDPMGCRCTALEDAVLAKCRGKRLVIILNKVDLVPAEVTQRWLSYLRQYFPTLPFKATTQSKREVSSSTQSASVGKLGSYGAEAYGGDGLLQLLKNYSRSLGMKTSITVGIVGYPNVGKSSLINSLKRARAANVGATPGVTTVAQTIALDSKVKLMDCPGIIFARAGTAEEQADVLLRNCVRVEQVEDPSVPVEAILRRVPNSQLMRQYEVTSFGSALEFLTLVAVKRGMLRKGGAADQDAAGRAVLHDWNSGLIKYHTEPPKPTGGVALVPRLAETFDWEAAPRVVEQGEAEAEQAAQRAQAAAVEGGGGAAGSSGARAAQRQRRRRRARRRWRRRRPRATRRRRAVRAAQGGSSTAGRRRTTARRRGSPRRSARRRSARSRRRLTTTSGTTSSTIAACKEAEGGEEEEAEGRGGEHAAWVMRECVSRKK